MRFTKHMNKAGEIRNSKSELCVEDALIAAGLEYDYEKPFGPFKPDFTIYYEDLNFWWEHRGMLDDPQYADYWYNVKQPYYQQSGVWDRFIVTTETNGSLDLRDIAKGIDYIKSYSRNKTLTTHSAPTLFTVGLSATNDPLRDGDDDHVARVYFDNETLDSISRSRDTTYKFILTDTGYEMIPTPHAGKIYPENGKSYGVYRDYHVDHSILAHVCRNRVMLYKIPTTAYVFEHNGNPAFHINFPEEDRWELQTRNSRHKRGQGKASANTVVRCEPAPCVPPNGFVRSNAIGVSPDSKIWQAISADHQAPHWVLDQTYIGSFRMIRPLLSTDERIVCDEILNLLPQGQVLLYAVQHS